MLTVADIGAVSVCVAVCVIIACDIWRHRREMRALNRPVPVKARHGSQWRHFGTGAILILAVALSGHSALARGAGHGSGLHGFPHSGTAHTSGAMAHHARHGNRNRGAVSNLSGTK